LLAEQMNGKYNTLNAALSLKFTKRTKFQQKIIKNKQSQMEDLTNQLLKTSCYCLNESPRAPFSNLFIGDHTLPLRL
jgi:hypothetical protein